MRNNEIRSKKHGIMHYSMNQINEQKHYEAYFVIGVDEGSETSDSGAETEQLHRSGEMDSIPPRLRLRNLCELKRSEKNYG